MEPLQDRLPLVIGVTGHRDLREQNLPELNAGSPPSSPICGTTIRAPRRTPIIVLRRRKRPAVARVALAQGARLVAAADAARRIPPGFRARLKPATWNSTSCLRRRSRPRHAVEPGNSLRRCAPTASGASSTARSASSSRSIATCSSCCGTARMFPAGPRVAGFKRDGIHWRFPVGARSLDASSRPGRHIVTPREKTPMRPTPSRLRRGDERRSGATAAASLAGPRAGSPSSSPACSAGLRDARRLERQEQASRKLGNIRGAHRALAQLQPGAAALTGSSEGGPGRDGPAV